MNRTRRAGLGVLGTLCVLVVAACHDGDRRGDADLQIALEIEPTPARVGSSIVSVVVSDVDWQPRNGATVVVTGSRDSVQLVVDTARGQGAGRYEAPDFTFQVAGDWLLNIRVETADGRWMEMDYPVEVVAGEVDGDGEEGSN